MDLSTESALATITSSGRVSNFTASSPEEGERERKEGQGERKWWQPLWNKQSSSLTCQQSNEHWAVAKVPEHEQLSPGDSTSSNVTKQVNMSIPETLLKAQYHLKKNILRTLSIISVLLHVATLKIHVCTCSVMWRSAHRHSTHDLA